MDKGHMDEEKKGQSASQQLTAEAGDNGGPDFSPLQASPPLPPQHISKEKKLKFRHRPEGNL